MRHCTLYLYDVKTKEALHARLRGALMLPDYYGGNLDALNDCLTDPGEETSVAVYGYDSLAETLGGYAVTFRSVLEHAAEVNERFSVTFH